MLLSSARFQGRGLPLMCLGATFDKPGGYLLSFLFLPDFKGQFDIPGGYLLSYLVLPDFKDGGYL